MLFRARSALRRYDRGRGVKRRERRNSRRSRTSRAGMQTPLFNPASIKLSHQAAAVRWAAEPQRSIWFWVAAMIENQKIRPAMVIGPLGEPLTLESLPPRDTKRWVVRRKAEDVAAVTGGLLTIAEACEG